MTMLLGRFLECDPNKNSDASIFLLSFSIVVSSSNGRKSFFLFIMTACGFFIACYKCKDSILVTKNLHTDNIAKFEKNKEGGVVALNLKDMTDKISTRPTAVCRSWHVVRKKRKCIRPNNRFCDL